MMLTNVVVVAVTALFEVVTDVIIVVSGDDDVLTPLLFVLKGRS
jgi:hypothetical protein